MQTEARWEKDGCMLRCAQPQDAEAYYAQNYTPLDREAARLTGCRDAFSKQEVLAFFDRCINDGDRILFLLITPDGRIAGETVLNEIDPELRCANFRIGIFHPADRGRGLGSWMVRATRDYAFEQLRLHRLELDVYSFNPRAEAVYRKAGFRREGVLRDAVLDNGRYADDILMALLEEEWRAIKAAGPGE